MLSGMADQRPRFAVYLRISRDPDGTSTAPDRQLKDCKAFAKLRGWEIAEVFRDADVSAFRKGVKRPAYEEMVSRLDEFDGVLVWRLDRLVRRTVEFARFWEAAEAAGVRLASATQPIDTSDPVGMLIVNILIAFAQMESETMSIRQKAKELELAEAGIHKTAGKRAYGMKPGWSEVEPGEAKIIREVADRLLAGESVGSLVKDLNTRGIPSATGRRWTRRALLVLMRSPRLWGFREHLGEIAGRGSWPAILDEAAGRALRELLDRPNGQWYGNRRKHLLSGILRCGRCGARLRVGRANGGQRRYQCPPKGDGGCGGIAIQADPTDEAVETMVLSVLSSPEMARALAARRGKAKAGNEAEILVELAEVEREREQNSVDKAAGAISRETFLSLQRALDRRSEELSAQLAAHRRRQPLDVLTPAGAQGIVERYRSLPVERRRAVIDAVAERITVMGTDDPKYIELLAERLAEEADGYRADAAELRRQAAEADDPGERTALRKRAEKRDADARRRLRQARNGASSANVFRVERLAPVWRA
jgi:site-specific DNA recombinase